MWRTANGYDRVRRVGNRRRGTNGDPDREWPDTTHPAVRCGDPERRLSAHRRHPTSSRAWCCRQRPAYRHALPQPRATIAKTVRLLDLP